VTREHATKPLRIFLASFNWVEYLIQIGNELAALGHDVQLGLKTDRVAATVGDELEKLLDPRVRYHLLDDRPRGLRDPRQLGTILRFMRLLRETRPDVVHLHDASTTYLPFCLRTSCRAPLVLTIHDVTTHPGEDSDQPGRRARVRSYLRRRADAVILHGVQLERQYLAMDGGRCKSTFVIPHGCYTVFRHWARPGVRERPHSVLFFGRIHQYKGLDVLLEAADLVQKTVPDVKILIAGAGRDLDHRATLEDDPRCIVRRGYLSNAEVAEVFQEASLVVLPYIEGSQSGVVRIAYVFGKPVVVTNVGSLSEAVRPGVTGLIVPPRDPRALADAIVSLLSDPERLRAMSEAARRMPDEDLSWKRIARETVRVYRDVLSR